MTISLALAVLPVLVLCVYIYTQDSYEKEPIGLLLSLLGLGVLSAIPAIIFEMIADPILKILFAGTPMIYYFLDAMFGVAVIEEGVKFGAARIRTWRSPHFNYKFDGIVYCLFASMGFALIENIKYVFENDFDMKVSILRGLTAIPCHAMCSIFMGYYYGNAKYCDVNGDRAGCRKNLIRGFITAVALHGFYDFCCFTQQWVFVIIFYIFVAVMDILTFVKIRQARQEDMNLYEIPVIKRLWFPPHIYNYSYARYMRLNYPTQTLAEQQMEETRRNIYRFNNVYSPAMPDQNRPGTPPRPNSF